MLTYNSQLKKLVLPEYGRNIQQMVDHCLTIEDRAERTRCAFTIVQNMANMFPQLRGETDYQHKLWDHLMIMSGFQLDVDAPFERAWIPSPFPSNMNWSPSNTAITARTSSA